MNFYTKKKDRNDILKNQDWLDLRFKILKDLKVGYIHNL